MIHDISTSIQMHLSNLLRIVHPCPGCAFVQIRPGSARESFRVSLTFSESAVCEASTPYHLEAQDRAMQNRPEKCLGFICTNPFCFKRTVYPFSATESTKKD